MGDTYCIYRIVNFKNGKCYIGLTVDPKARKRAHFGALRRGTHYNAHLQKSYNLYGKSAFYFEIIEENISDADIKGREQFWVAHFDSEQNGYNRTPGGDDRGGDCVNPCTWNGIQYRSISEAARAYGLTPKAMRMRLKKGFTCDDHVKSWEKRCAWNDVEYPSVKAAAKANGVTKATMEQRIRKGYTSDADVFVNGKSCIWNGIEYPNILEAAKANNLNPQAMGYRIIQGYTCDSDIPVKGYRCTWNGIEYASVTEAARACGVNRSTMETRFKRGYTSDADFERPSKARLNNPMQPKVKS